MKDQKAEKVYLRLAQTAEGIPVLCKDPEDGAATAPRRPRESSLESPAALTVTGEHSKVSEVLEDRKNPPRRRQNVYNWRPC